MLHNLLQNALKFTLKGFIKVSIDCDDIETMIIIRVRDSGVGMSVEKQERIFRIFSDKKGQA